MAFESTVLSWRLSKHNPIALLAQFSDSAEHKYKDIQHCLAFYRVLLKYSYLLITAMNIWSIIVVTENQVTVATFSSCVIYNPPWYSPFLLVSSIIHHDIHLFFLCHLSSTMIFTFSSCVIYHPPWYSPFLLVSSIIHHDIHLFFLCHLSSTMMFTFSSCVIYHPPWYSPFLLVSSIIHHDILFFTKHLDCVENVSLQNENQVWKEYQNY